MLIYSLNKCIWIRILYFFVSNSCITSVDVCTELSVSVAHVNNLFLLSCCLQDQFELVEMKKIQYIL